MRLQFRDGGRTVRRVRDTDTAMGQRLSAGKAGGAENFSEASETPTPPMWGTGNKIQHLASFPPAHERDPNGGGYIIMTNSDGFHVAFVPGTAWETGAVSGIDHAQMTPGRAMLATTGDVVPYTGQPRIENHGARVEEYVSNRISPEAPAGTQDGHRLGSHANPSIVRMNRRAKAARDSESSPATTDSNNLVAQMNRKARAAWAGKATA